VIWTEDGVAGAYRFVQRIWRLAGEVAALPKGCANASGPEAMALRKAAHKSLAAVEENIAALRFNVAVARIYELVNAIAAALARLPAAGDPGLAAAAREAMELLVEMMAPMMPHLAESCWEALGHDGLVATRPWPAVARDLLAEDTVTLPVQVNGKRRAELTIAADASQADIETAILALEAVQRALAGAAPKKIVVVPKRIVNVVT
jgi:leucyl-tRNA synthetase